MQWMGAARSNYFAVKDPEAFRREIMCWPGVEGLLETPASEVLPDVPEDLTLYGFYADSGDGIPWLSDYEEPDGSEWHDEMLLTDLLARHLQQGWVAVVMESGFEGSYPTASAWAVDSTGHAIERHLSIVIHQESERLDGTITEIG